MLNLSQVGSKGNTLHCWRENREGESVSLCIWELFSAFLLGFCYLLYSLFRFTVYWHLPTLCEGLPATRKGMDFIMLCFKIKNRSPHKKRSISLKQRKKKSWEEISCESHCCPSASFMPSTNALLQEQSLNEKLRLLFWLKQTSVDCWSAICKGGHLRKDMS